MTLSELLADCYRRLALPAVPNSTETTRLTSFLNTTHRQILGLPGMERLRDDTLWFTVHPTVPGRQSYGLPQIVERIEAITDRTNHIKLTLRTLQELRATDPGLTATGIPHSYIVRGYQQVQIQPPMPCHPHVFSHAAGDTTVVHVEGVGEYGDQRKVAVTLTGTTPVPVAASADWVEVTKFYLETPALATVAICIDAADTLDMAAIIPPLTYARYLGITFYPIPTAVNMPYYVDYVRNIFEMVNPTDEPLLPSDFHWLLVEGVLLKEWTKRDDDRRVTAEREYAKGISALKYFVNCYADHLPVMNSRWIERPSRYGPWYPATRGF
jgi:hypothetical protein